MCICDPKIRTPRCANCPDVKLAKDMSKEELVDTLKDTLTTLEYYHKACESYYDSELVKLFIKSTKAKLEE